MTRAFAAVLCCGLFLLLLQGAPSHALGLPTFVPLACRSKYGTALYLMNVSARLQRAGSLCGCTLFSHALRKILLSESRKALKTTAWSVRLGTPSGAAAAAHAPLTPHHRHSLLQADLLRVKINCPIDFVNYRMTSCPANCKNILRQVKGGEARTLKVLVKPCVAMQNQPPAGALLLQIPKTCAQEGSKAVYGPRAATAVGNGYRLCGL